MKKLIEFLFSGCWHEWEIIKEMDFISTKKYTDGLKTEDEYKIYILRCKKCGEIIEKTIGRR